MESILFKLPNMSSLSNLVIQHLPFQISVHLLEGVIDSPWIRSQELKYLLASLYNVGVVLYRNKELKKVEYLLFDFLYILHANK